ncbi:MAG: hypothetical protein GX541_00035 [Clostridiales bacterium]|nr:hypothetical protein [Clostridiales bacterium]
MDNALRNCFVARIFNLFKSAYPRSLPGRLQRGLLNYYDKSVTKRLLVLFLVVSPRIVYSGCYRLLKRFNAFLNRFNGLFSESLAFSITKARVFEGSAVFRLLSYLKPRGILLIAFGLFLPLDVFVRDVIEIGFLSAVWDEALLLVAALAVLLRRITAENPLKPKTTPIDAYLLLFIGVGLLLMAIVSPSASIAFAGYRAVCQFMLWFFVVTRLIENDKDFMILYFTISIMAVAVALHGVYQYIVRAPMPENWVAQAEATLRTRVYSITGSPNIMGALMVMTAPMLAALAYYLKPLWLKCLMWGGTFVCCLATLFTFSRGAWFGLAIAVVVFALAVDRRLLLAAVCAVFGLVLFVPEISNRIGFLFTTEFAEANSTGGRGERWEFGRMLIRSNPVFGFGLGRFGGAIAMQNQVIDGMNYFYMDNYYLKTLVEMGFVGLITYLYLLVNNLVWGLRAMFKTRRKSISALAAGLYSGAAGVLAHSFFENIFEVPYMNSYFWGFAAMIMYVGFLRRVTEK